jgi:hypothetical protein
MCLQTPQASSPSQTEGDTLAAQVKYAPQVYQENAEFGPKYTALDLNNLSSFLTGENGQPGFLQQYQDSIMPALTNSQISANSAIRAGNVSDAAALTPAITAETNASNPMAASLLSQLGNSTSQQLSYGTELTPAERTQLNQSVRSGSAARGMGFGPSDVFNESMADTGEGQALLAQRQGAAQNLVPTLQSFYGNPLQMLSGMGSTAGETASGITSAAMGGAAPAQSSEFNPESSMAQLLAGQQFDSNVAKSNNENTWVTAPTSYAENA